MGGYVDSFMNSPLSHKALALGIMAGGLILMDSALPGTGLLLAIAIGIGVILRTNVSDWVVKLFNYGATPVKRPGSAGN